VLHPPNEIAFSVGLRAARSAPPPRKRYSFFKDLQVNEGSPANATKPEDGAPETQKDATAPDASKTPA
jgi:hypothetical protein